MTTASHHSDDRLLLLMADRALGEIDPSEAMELEKLLNSTEAEREALALEAAAAAVGVALASAGLDDMPRQVRERLNSTAHRWLAGQSNEADSVRQAVRGVQAHSGVAQPIPLPVGAGVTPRTGRTPILAWTGWLAAAACLILALIGWTQGGAGRTPEVSAAERYAQMIQKSGIVRVDWTANTAKPEPLLDADRVGGDVVWDPVTQRGYMRIQGLKPNDPSEGVYQLWVFDATRDAAHPVDGGVFNIASDGSGEVIVPFEPRVAVREATLFAVTVEPPGGVVVSSRERLPILAQVSGG